MKKFIGVLLTVILCMCMTVPAAFAAAEDALTEGIAGLVGGIISGDGSLESLDLGSFDLGGIIEGFAQEEKDNEETDTQVKLEQGLQDAMDTVASKLPSADTTGIDLSWLTTLLGDSVDAEVVNETFADVDTAEMSSLLTVIADAFGGAGIDMTAFSIDELGKFDITTLLGGAEEVKPSGTATDVAPDDSSMATTDLVTGILDTLRGGLTTIGIDADALLGSMADNELINFFANMYIGFVGPVAEDTSTSTSTESTPETGDTSSVVVALATLCVATATAGVCLKKKED